LQSINEHFTQRSFNFRYAAVHSFSGELVARGEHPNKLRPERIDPIIARGNASVVGVALKLHTKSVEELQNNDIVGTEPETKIAK